jgi:diguanylate cyclase (GGDEF)-like protein
MVPDVKSCSESAVALRVPNAWRTAADSRKGEIPRSTHGAGCGYEPNRKLKEQSVLEQSSTAGVSATSTPQLRFNTNAHPFGVDSLSSAADVAAVMRRFVRNNAVAREGTVLPPNVRGVRQGGMFFLILGVAGFTGYLIPGGRGYHHASLLVIIPLVLVTGALARTRIAWRLTGYRSLVIPTIGLLSVAACNTAGLLSPVPLGVYFIVVFLWIGQWHPPGTALRFAPVGLVAYLAPYALGAPKDDSTVSSVVIVLAASIMVAEVVARQTAAVVRARGRQAEALEALSRASLTDDLTGLGNRRLGNRLLDGLTPGDSMILLDVDNFKMVNDTLGHSCGDRLLQELGAFLLLEVRGSDTVARMGGEEFMVVIKATGVATAVDVANRLVDRWRDTTPLATVSAGVAMHTHDKSPAATYARADDALYRAKTTGRDRVVQMAHIGPALS